MTRSFKRLLIAGGAGFIGSNFVRLILAHRPELRITVLDSLEYSGNQANLAGLQIDFVHGSITNAGLVDGLAKEADAIVNFAAQTHVDRSLTDSPGFVRANIEGTAVLCDAARRHGHEVYMHVSTDEVYGYVPAGRSVETDPFRPRSPYSASKAGAEMIVNAYSETYGLPALITRGSNTYGQFQYPEKLIPVLITNAIDGQKLPLYKDGSAVRDFIHVEDHCMAIDHVLHEAPAGGVYNVGTGVETSGKQVAEAVLDIMGKFHDQIEYVADRPGHDYRYALDVTRITHLGWEPRVNLADGLERTVRWYQDHQDWWRPLKSGEYWEFYRENYRPLVT